MKVFVLFGVAFRLNRLFLFVLLIFTFLGLFPKALLVFAMVFIHELAHLLTAVSLGLQVEEVEILPFGGVARIGEDLALYPRAEILIALVGPLCSIFLGVVGYSLLPYVGHHCLLFLARINMTIGLFNLIPAFPLDGGRVFRSLLTMYLGLYQGTQGALYLSKGIALILGGASIWGIWLGEGSIFLLIISFFIYYLAIEEYQGLFPLMIKYLLQKERIYEGATITSVKALVVKEEIPLIEVVKRFFPQHVHLLYVVDGDLLLKGVLFEGEIIEYLLKGHDFHTPIRQLIID